MALRSRRGSATPHIVEALFELLVIAVCETARLDGYQIHLMAYGNALVVDRTGFGYPGTEFLRRTAAAT